VESSVLVSASENKPVATIESPLLTSSGASSSSKVSSCNLEVVSPVKAAQGIHPQLPKGSHQRIVCRIAQRRWVDVWLLILKWVKFQQR
jgi:hypothetical protein